MVIYRKIYKTFAALFVLADFFLVTESALNQAGFLFNATFEDLATQPDGPCYPPLLPTNLGDLPSTTQPLSYDTLVFRNIFCAGVVLESPGSIEPASGSRLGVYSPSFEDPNNRGAVIETAREKQLMDFESFAFGCTTDLPEGLANPALFCNITAIPDGDNRRAKSWLFVPTLPINEIKELFNPLEELPSIPMKVVKPGTSFRGIKRVELKVARPDLGILAPLLALLGIDGSQIQVPKAIEVDDVTVFLRS